MKIKVPVVVLAVIAALASCQKEDFPPAVPSAAAINVINVSAGSINFFMNGNRLNNTSTIYPDGISGYLNVYAGPQNYQLKRDGSSAVAVTLPFNLDSAQRYTLFAAGLDTANVILVKDAFTADTGNVALIRFVNASPKVNGITILLNDTAKITNASYRSVSNFVRVGTGTKELTLSGSGSALLADSITLVRGRAYTIYSKGDPAISGDAGFGAGIIEN